MGKGRLEVLKRQSDRKTRGRKEIDSERIEVKEREKRGIR
jgi:hypothetical protein